MAAAWSLGPIELQLDSVEQRLMEVKQEFDGNAEEASEVVRALLKGSRHVIRDTEDNCRHRRHIDDRLGEVQKHNDAGLIEMDHRQTEQEEHNKVVVEDMTAKILQTRDALTKSIDEAGQKTEENIAAKIQQDAENMDNNYNKEQRKREEAEKEIHTRISAIEDETCKEKEQINISNDDMVKNKVDEIIKEKFEAMEKDVIAKMNELDKKVETDVLKMARRINEHPDKT